jgi:hypothetical protein
MREKRGQTYLRILKINWALTGKFLDDFSEEPDLCQHEGADIMKNKPVITRQFLLTPAAGKRLIAKSLALLPGMSDALADKTIVIIAGTTNGYVAEEFLNMTGQGKSFSRSHFFRGITLPPGGNLTAQGRPADESRFPGDVVIRKGIWESGKTIHDVVDELGPGDIIIKGANAVNPASGQAAIYIGHPRGGTIGLAMQAVIGRRVGLVIPVGLEKRVGGDLQSIAGKLNDPNAEGFRYFVTGGTIVTELEAIRLLSGADAELVAAGGVCGAEGSCWIAVSGEKDAVEKAGSAISAVSGEPPFMR